MAGRSSHEREALARQNAALIAVFERSGFDHIAPDIIQPADIFLERSGEAIRTRTFVFSDPGGKELCLRPDLTVPACRYHLSHADKPQAAARYCYLGPAFRYAEDKACAEEQVQAGLEWFGGLDPVAEDARVLKLTLSALEAAGASGLKVTMGDLGLFSALLDDIEMPERWRLRLRRQFWRPQAFRDLLAAFSDGAKARRTSISNLIDQIATTDATAVAERAMASLPLIGGRDLGEIAQRLQEKFDDRSEKPIAPEMRGAIESYLAVEGSVTDVLGKLLAVGGGAYHGKAVADFERRIHAFEEQGLNPRRFAFSATFGRELEYYTGFVFQIEANGVVVAGGGRYDALLRDMGAAENIPAVGSAIFTQALKRAIG
jgi:ATP phosphoribosyltransferase regulatory subunit